MAMTGEAGDDPDQQDRRAFGARTGGRAVFTGVGPLCETATRMTGVDGAAAALLTSRSLVRDLVYATDPLAQRIDELQFTLGQGPCLDAYIQARPQLVPDLRHLSTIARWPGFVDAALAVGAAAVFAFHLGDADRPLGVLELYRATAGPLSSHEYDAALACAAQAGQTVAASWADYACSRAGDLSSSAADALAVDLSDPDVDSGFSRAHVFTASGMLAVQMGAPADDALDRLRAFAYLSGRPIGEIADDIIARRLTHTDLDDRASP